MDRFHILTDIYFGDHSLDRLSRLACLLISILEIIPWIV